jgi:hypothetical protein
LNERIRQLADEAEFSEKDLHIQGDNFQKFAELMVQDCIRTLRSNGYDDAAKCLQDIHFGIENPV